MKRKIVNRRKDFKKLFCGLYSASTTINAWLSDQVRDNFNSYKVLKKVNQKIFCLEINGELNSSSVWTVNWTQNFALWIRWILMIPNTDGWPGVGGQAGYVQPAKDQHQGAGGEWVVQNGHHLPWHQEQWPSPPDCGDPAS